MLGGTPAARRNNRYRATPLLPHYSLRASWPSNQRIPEAGHRDPMSYPSSLTYGAQYPYKVVPCWAQLPRHCSSTSSVDSDGLWLHIRPASPHTLASRFRWSASKSLASATQEPPVPIACHPPCPSQQLVPICPYSTVIHTVLPDLSSPRPP